MLASSVLKLKVGDAPLPAPPGVAVRALLALRRALLRAADAVVPPQVAMLERVLGAGGSHLLAELARLGVADLLAERPMTGDEIAAHTRTDPDAMKRAMRAAVAVGVFARGEGGTFANNRLSETLRSGDIESVRAFAEYFGSRSNMLAWCDLRETLRTGETAFERVHGMDVWAWFDAHPHERETFAHAMTSMTLIDAPGIAKTYPFGEVKRVCDVGGGRGALLSEILLRHRHLRGVLCDAPGVLDSARRLLAERGVLDRVELVPGSFFDGVPSGADAYVLKHVLHDWDDARCLRILERCRAAMRPGHRVLVVEALVEDDCEDHGALADIQMMLVCGEGRERGRADYERLLRKSGLSPGRVLEAPTPVAIVEGVLQ